MLTRCIGTGTWGMGRTKTGVGRMNWILLAVAVVAGLAVVTALLLPATTRTTVEIRFDAPIRAVWAVYADFESQPNWRSDVARVEMASDERRWTETLEMSGMTVHFQILEESPPNRLVLKTGADGSFEGRYVAEFRAENGGTVGTFTEEASALGILPKVMRRLLFNQEKFIADYAEEAKAEIGRRESEAGGY
ncbi:MAG: SRPBCC family protein [Gammaproteobacteria bacterium]|nr:SRPBCC family protein [Gammaproteobacteria bacterium]